MPPIQLLADLGATNSRFAIASPGGRTRFLRILRAADYASPLAAARHYIAELPASERPTSGAIAVAAPIVAGRIRFVNLGWSFTIGSLQRGLGFSDLHVLNDLEAQAYALLTLRRHECPKIGKGHPVASAPQLAIGPGTGLGMACLIYADSGPCVLPSEGGHQTLAAATREDEKLIGSLRRRYGHVSAERALSGPGLAALYSALSSKATTLQPAEIAARARARSDARAVATADAFSRLLGCYCGNMALAFSALGGVYIVGGVVPGLGRAFNRRAFRAAFESKGRYRDYLARIPVAIVLRKDLGLRGLSTYLALRGTRRG
ncbi:MAG TPA: glucokinase [Alphaproteobacteria bacterium]|nr:glucokinase [Alphaproteobacteria bacterium]